MKKNPWKGTSSLICSYCSTLTRGGRGCWLIISFNLVATPPLHTNFHLFSFSPRSLTLKSSIYHYCKRHIQSLLIKVANIFHLYGFVLSIRQPKRTNLSQLLHLHSTVKSPSIRAAPRCFQRPDQKQGETQSQHPWLFIHSVHTSVVCWHQLLAFRRCACMALCYWWDLNYTWDSVLCLSASDVSWLPGCGWRWATSRRLLITLFNKSFGIELIYAKQRVWWTYLIFNVLYIHSHLVV